MKLTSPGQILLIPLDLIDLRNRVRPVTEAAVDLLAVSMAERGIAVPVDVRKIKGGRYQLIDGAHRVTVARRLGLTEIAAQEWDCTLQEARMMEVDANLSTAHVAPLDLAVSLAERKKAYLALHPEAKGGVAGALAKHGLQGTEMSFAEFLGKALNVTPRQINRIVAAGDALSPDEIGLLRTAPRAVVMDDLYTISKVREPDERRRVCHLLSLGEVKSAAKARAYISAETGGVQPPVKDPVEAEFKALLTAWSRASMAAKKRFLLDQASEVWSAQNKGVALQNWAEATEA